jgi:serine/threonine protein kinase
VLTVVRSIHEDIRPENILLMGGPSGSPYDFTPKIVDFGLYSRVRTMKAMAGESMGPDMRGNQRFSKPHDPAFGSLANLGACVRRPRVFSTHS